MNNGWPSAVARRIGLGGEINFTQTRVGQTLHVPCRGRGRHQAHIVDVPIAPGQHPDAVAKKLLGQGWRIGHRLLCPGAYQRAEREREEPEVATIAESSTPTPAAGRARRLVYMALEDYYDEAKKCYKPGHSDASIAKECGVSETVVCTIREESYGPLAVPMDLSGIMADLRTMRRELTVAHQTQTDALEAVEKKIEGLIDKNGWKRP